MGRLWELVEDLDMKRAKAPATSTVMGVKLKTETPPDPLTDLLHPRERLARYLDTWAGMDESAWPEANVKALYDDIMDLFHAHPEAEAWYRAWRTAHPEARLG